MVAPCAISLTSCAKLAPTGFGDLSVHTVATNATHANGFVELDVHNLFGYVSFYFPLPMMMELIDDVLDIWRRERRI